MLTPVLKESKFKETGVLTPEEFLTAGDHLVHHCPTWHWEKAANPAGIKEYLPAEKQFLITRRVPCHRRCLDMDYDPGLEKIIHGGDANEDPQDEWVDTHHFATDTAQVSAAAEPEKASAARVKPLEEEAEEDDDAPPMDMDAFMESGALEEDDPNRYVPPKAKQNTSEGSQVPGNADDNILRTRTYDLHITYDKYY
ncbi:Autophagocytosis associated proteinC-terminal domain containing protein [Aphelenchoides avenae]|nr:Autophagocytosis associated proteinC-terminal domain containing protein [Aphelenchus avenae]